MKDLLNMWINKENQLQPYYLGEFELEELNQRISSVKFPHTEESRFPRKISSKSLKEWKAQEFISFLIRYGPVVLQGMLLKICSHSKICYQIDIYKIS